MSDLAYILSPSYSGSTLLTCLMATHPDVATVGELKASPLGDVASYRCSCGNPILLCPFWDAVGRGMRQRGVAFSPTDFGTHFRSQHTFVDRVLHADLRNWAWETLRATALHLPQVRRSYRAILERNRLLIEVILDIQKGKLFLDGSKDAIRLRYFRSVGFWNIKVIYLLRDGRGTTNSIARHHGLSIEAAAREWVRTQKECDRAAEALPSTDLIVLKYEDLCADPAKTMQSIYRFLGLDPHGGRLSYQASEHHIMGNAMRLHSFDSIRQDEKWKNALSANDLKVFQRVAGSLNRKYGYLEK